MSKDPSQNYIGLGPEPLKNFFHPKSVALIGAKDDLGSVGRTLILNLLSTYKGEIYPVNPKRETVFKLKCYPTFQSIAKTIDLAIIVTPAKTIPQIMRDIMQTDTKAVIIISAGFKETGTAGLALENEIALMARDAGIRIIGPNCLGVMNPLSGFNATFAKGIAIPGTLAFVSQSGAMCTAVLDYSFEENIGFSAFVSIGSMCDVGWGDLIRYLGNDPHTQSILIYMETVGDTRSFLSAVRETAIEKPIIVIKGGRSTQSAIAAASHTGSMAGSDEVFEAALERAGCLRVNTISELFDMASLMARQPLPKGPNLAIITNAGGPAVLATDAAVLNGAEIGPLSKETIQKLDAFLPLAWSRANPVDILGDAPPDRYYKTVTEIASDKLVDGILTILSPQDMTDPTGCAEELKMVSKIIKKPLIASWMGGASVKEGMRLLNESGIPAFSYPDDAAKAFSMMWKYSRNLALLYEMPYLTEDLAKVREGHAKKIIQKATNEGRTLLTEDESKRLLQTYGFPIVETLVAATVEDAVKHAEKIGFPIVLKIFSKTITHKTDVGGVKLGLNDKMAVTKAFYEIKTSFEALNLGAFEGVTVQAMIKHTGYELILGSSVDLQFGPMVLFGSGGQLVEIYKDTALGLPPLNFNLAKQLILKTKISKAFSGYRGKPPIDIDELSRILVRFSVMIAENLRIKECDINPLIASSEGMIALDARIVLHDVFDPLVQTAIRPYPRQYIKEVALNAGIKVTLRPITPGDQTQVIAFHKELSEHSVRQRYFEFLSLSERIAKERLIKICFNDYERELAIVIECDKKIIGIGRLSKVGTLDEGIMTLIIQDDWHGMGLGSLMVEHLVHIGKEENWKRIAAHVLNENSTLIHILKKNGFKRLELKPSDIEIWTLDIL